MKILLTGSNGFLGNYIYKYLIKEHLIDTLNRSNSTYNVNLANVIPSLNNDYELVIHCAGLAHNNSISDFSKVNVEGTDNLLKGLKSNRLVRNFIFISSVSVYGIQKGENIDENCPLNAKDPYGKSKIAAEKLIIEWCSLHNVNFTILRLPLIIGPHPPGNFGSMIKAIQNGYYFNIAGGKEKKSMVLVEDVAKSILKAAEIGGIYNFTDGYHPSFEEISNCVSMQLSRSKPLNLPLWLAIIIAFIGDLFGSKSPLNTYKLKKITSELTFDDSKARNAFGWNPTKVLEGFRLNCQE